MSVLKSLQMGRGLAAMAVAAYHLSIATSTFIGVAVFSELTDRGFLGVDFFFVLSGFIILQAHESDIGRPDRLRSYLTKRAIRIYPIYWLYTSLAVAAMIAIGSKNLELRGLSDWFSTYALMRVSEAQTPLRQGWTLFHEIAFYAVFATLIVSARWGRAVFAAWALTIALMHFYPDHDRPTFFGTVLGAYNLNFFLGMAAYSWSKHATRNAAWFVMLIGLSAFAANLWTDEQGAQLQLRQFVYGVSFALLIGAAAALELRGAWVSIPLLELIGDASYSTYLLHEHVENYSLRAIAKFKIDQFLPSSAIFLIVLAVTAGAGVLAYWFVERTLLDGLRRRLPARTAKAAAA